MSLLELIDGGLCETQPRRCQPSGIPDGDLDSALGVLRDSEP
jgi:hypothetical protein